MDPLAAARLRRRCDPETFPFETTADLTDGRIVGQDRALEAVTFATGIRRPGYNVFALGPEGIGKRTVIHQSFDDRAATERAPFDWCYVNDFADPQRPRALRLPTGNGVRLRDDMERLVRELRSAIPAAFESESCRSRREALEAALKARRDEAMGELEERAGKLGIAVIRTPVGTALATIRKGAVLGPEDFKKLPPDEQERLRVGLERLETGLAEIVRRVPRWERDHREQVRELDREVTRLAVSHLIDELRASYAELPEVLAHLDTVEADLVEHAVEAIAGEQSSAALPVAVRALAAEPSAFRRYEVNLLVDHSHSSGAPVVEELNPTYANLVGRVEYVAHLGALVTDFSLLRPGALHRANGGYLILEARQVLTQPYAWEALKRALRAGEIRIESLGQALGLVSTVSLEPQPIPLDVKVALVGDRLIYYLLCEHDPEFLELFKVEADFDEQIERTAENDLVYARLLGSLARKHGLRALDRSAVARVIEHAARILGDAERLSTHMRDLSDLLHEADYLAAAGERTAIAAADVEAAIEARTRRAGRLRERVHEQIGRGAVRVETAGETVGQVNGLVVAEVGGFSFGWPGRITARIGVGRGEVVDVEREIELGGPIHSKGVLILAGFLGGRFGGARPLTLRASIVLEQSYGPVEGDSASLAEACALLSALGEVPIRQSLAMTGSIDQLGRAQAIGGVNEKIEGFFDVCAARGLTGQQGVLIPATNVDRLMLRPDIVEAAEAGRFHVWAVETVDQAMELLTGRPAGERDAAGAYPPDSINGLVEARLAALAELAREFAGERRPDPPPS